LGRRRDRSLSLMAGASVPITRVSTPAAITYRPFSPSSHRGFVR
jgi:hypothetical protein